jgi:hypothetical protein
MTRETVATETPARSAISRIVTRGRRLGAVAIEGIRAGFADFRNNAAALFREFYIEWLDFPIPTL